MKKSSLDRAVFICPVCHRVFGKSSVHHQRRTIRCDAGRPGDERSKPLYDGQGNLISRAPRWWIEACKISSRRPRLKKLVGEK